MNSHPKIRKTGLNILIISILSVMLQACDPGMVYDHFEKTPGGAWNWSEEMVFTPVITDSVQTYNLYLSVRHTRDYPKSNLYVFLDITGPTGATRRDTIEFTLAEPSGKWTGNGFGPNLLVRKPYRHNIHFPYKGSYTFRIQQAMRLEEIPVTDVGVRIEKYREIR